jgi:hypothetical protein
MKEEGEERAEFGAERQVDDCLARNIAGEGWTEDGAERAVVRHLRFLACNGATNEVPAAKAAYHNMTSMAVALIRLQDKARTRGPAIRVRGFLDSPGWRATEPFRLYLPKGVN